MEEVHEKTISLLSNLLAVSSSANSSFEEAAEVIEDVDLKQLFKKIAEKKLEYVSQLKTEIERINGKVKNENSQSINFPNDSVSNKEYKMKINNEDKLEILKISEKLEYDVMMNYSRTVKAELPGITKDIVTSQYNEIRDFHDNIKVLIEREKKAKHL